MTGQVADDTLLEAVAAVAADADHDYGASVAAIAAHTPLNEHRLRERLDDLAADGHLDVSIAPVEGFPRRLYRPV